MFPRPHGKIIHVDASFSNPLSPIEFGGGGRGVARDCLGRWRVGFERKTFDVDVLMAKCMAV